MRLLSQMNLSRAEEVGRGEWGHTVDPLSTSCLKRLQPPAPLKTSAVPKGPPPNLLKVC